MKTILFTILFLIISGMAIVMFALIDMSFPLFMTVYVCLGIILMIVGGLAWKGKEYNFFNIAKRLSIDLNMPI